MLIFNPSFIFAFPEGPTCLSRSCQLYWRENTHRDTHTKNKTKQHHEMGHDRNVTSPATREGAQPEPADTTGSDFRAITSMAVILVSE